MPVRDRREFEDHAQFLAEEVTAVQLPKFDDEDKDVSDQSFVSELLYLDDLEIILPFQATDDQLQKMTAEIMAEQTEAERQQVQQTEFERIDAARKDHSDAQQADAEAKGEAKAAAAVAAAVKAKANKKKHKKKMKAQAKANKKLSKLRSETDFGEEIEQPIGLQNRTSSFEMEGASSSSSSPSVPQLTPEEHEVERTRLIVAAAMDDQRKPSKTTHEVFCRWLGSIDSELADKLRKSLAGKRWSELGPLLVYTAILESRTSYFNPKKYGPFLFAGGRSGLQLTKFSMKGVWGVTKVAGKIAIPVARATLKTTALVSSVAEGSVAYIEATFSEADATQDKALFSSQVKALFSWIHDELGVATSMAVIAYSNMELEKSLAEIRNGVTAGKGSLDGEPGDDETDGKKKQKKKKKEKKKGKKGEQDTAVEPEPELELEADPQSQLESDGLQLIRFSTWFTSQSEFAAKLRTAVSEKKSGISGENVTFSEGSGSEDDKSEDDGKSGKQKKQGKKQLKKRLSEDAENKAAAESGKPQDASTRRKAAALQEHAELSQHLHEELDKIAMIFEKYFNQAEFDCLMQELDEDGDGELEFFEFCSKKPSASFVMRPTF
jgi:hypothetical protein